MNLWHFGPAFLREGRDHWPIGPASGEVLPAPKALELKTNLAIETAAPFPSDLPDRSTLAPLFERYSTLGRLKVAAAWWLRFRQCLRDRVGRVATGSSAAARALTAAELDRALEALVRTAQWGVYPHLMTALSALPANYHRQALGPRARQDWTSLRQLDPFLDEQGLLRVGGRLQRAGYSFSQTHPLILPRRHLLTARIVASCHTRNKHVGYRHVLAILRERFWVLGGSATIRHYLRGCVPCRHARAPLGVQKMAPLPASRFQVHLPAFSYTAVDYFGPLTVKITTRKTDGGAA